MSAPNANNPPFLPSSAYSHLQNQARQQVPQPPGQAPAQPGQQVPGQANAASAAPRMLQPQPQQPQPQQAQHPMQQPQPHHQMQQLQPQPQHFMQPQPADYPYPPAQGPAGVEAGGPPALRADRKRDREEGDVNDRAKRVRVKEEGDANDRVKHVRIKEEDVGQAAVDAAPVAPPQVMPNAPDPDTLCRDAIRAGDKDAFMALWTSGMLEGGADDFLDAAVSAGQTEIADVLLQAGADPNAHTADHGDPPIVTAALRNDLPMVQLLLRHHAYIDAWHVDGSEMTALAAATRYPDLALFKFLLAQGAITVAVNWRRREGDEDREEVEEGTGSGRPYTPLIEAAGHGNIEAVRLLLDNRADLAAQDQNFCDAFRRAAKSGHFDICQLLVERGAEVDAEPWGEGTEVVSSLTCAAEGGNIAILQMVIQAREQAGVKLADGKELRSAISCAVKGGHANSVLTLCSQQFELNLVAQPHSTTIAKQWMVMAIRAGNVDMMAALHQVLQSQFQGWQLDGHALCLEALAAQNQEALAWLVHHFKVDINAPGSMHGPGGIQVTLLMQASTTGNIPMMQQLLQMGAKIVVDRFNGQTAQRYSALEAALQAGQQVALRFLQDYLVARGNV